MKIFKVFHNLIKRVHSVLLDRRGAGETDVLPDVLWGTLAMQSIIIGGVTYLVRTCFKEDTSTTAMDKIARLIEKDAESSQ